MPAPSLEVFDLTTAIARQTIGRIDRQIENAVMYAKAHGKVIALSPSVMSHRFNGDTLGPTIELSYNYMELEPGAIPPAGWVLVGDRKPSFLDDALARDWDRAIADGLADAKPSPARSHVGRRRWNSNGRGVGMVACLATELADFRRFAGVAQWQSRSFPSSETPNKLNSLRASTVPTSAEYQP
jgi:hypothetical protein